MVHFQTLMFALWSLVVVTVRRPLRGPLHPSWSWRVELLARVAKWGALRAAAAKAKHVRAALRPAPVPSPIAARVTIESMSLGSLSAESITPSNWTSSDPVILYFHGGGYVICSPATHRDLLARIALASGARCIAVDYRLAPENPFPAALDDCVEAFRALIATGVGKDRLVLAGDSAGGGLCLATMLRLRDDHDPLPAAALLISPWVDHCMTGASIEENAPYDYIQREVLRSFSSQYLQGADPKDPFASPLYADLAGLPPLLLHAGGAEAIRWEVEAFAARAEEHGVDVTLFVAEGMIHAWHAFAPMLQEGRRDIRAMGAFVRERIHVGQRSPGKVTPALSDTGFKAGRE